jgi:hypothetical protein
MFVSKLLFVLATTTVFISSQAVEENWPSEDDFETSRGAAEDGDIDDVATIADNDDEENNPSLFDDLESLDSVGQSYEVRKSDTAKKGLNAGKFGGSNAEDLNQLLSDFEDNDAAKMQFFGSLFKKGAGLIGKLFKRRRRRRRRGGRRRRRSGGRRYFPYRPKPRWPSFPPSYHRPRCHRPRYGGRPYGGYYRG